VRSTKKRSTIVEAQNCKFIAIIAIERLKKMVDATGQQLREVKCFEKGSEGKI